MAPTSQSGDELKCLLSAVKRTNAVNAQMAESDPKRSSHWHRADSLPARVRAELLPISWKPRIWPLVVVKY